MPEGVGFPITLGKMQPDCRLVTRIPKRQPREDLIAVAVFGEVSWAKTKAAGAKRLIRSVGITVRKCLFIGSSLSSREAIAFELPSLHTLYPDCKKLYREEGGLWLAEVDLRGRFWLTRCIGTAHSTRCLNYRRHF